MAGVSLFFSFNIQTASAELETMGWLEKIYIDGLKPSLRTKLDSGALTSSIHGIVQSKFKKNGEEWVRFKFEWHKKSADKWLGPYIIEAPVARKVKVKDHKDESQDRLVVLLNFSLNGVCRSAEFSLADRTGFNYPVLLGRRFLKDGILINSGRSFTDVTDKKNACKNLTKVEKSSDKYSQATAKKL